jgi:hypothetical protein
MLTPALRTRPPSLHRRYAFAAKCILLKTISPPSHSTVHFIGAIIDDDTGNVLEYCHLMNTKRFGPTVLLMKMGNFSGALEMLMALTHFFSSPSHSFQLTTPPPTDAFAAITNHRRKRNNASGSPLVAIRSTIQETRAH